MIIESFCYEQTFELGKKLGQKALKGDIYCIKGDLGVGKTVFTKGVAAGLGIKEDITSPTFTIVNVYEGKFTLYHFDVYRIGSIEQMEDIGYEEMFFGDGICIIEWAEIVKEIIPKEAIWIEIQKDFNKGEDYRKITIKGDLK